jgi:glycosyltransferase involved in cell wall biosynthesis
MFPSHDQEPDGLALDNIQTDFNFLLFGQITGNNPENDRKNIFHTIRIMCDVFKDNPNVGLILKTNSGKATKIDRQITRNMLKQAISQVKKGPGPKIYLLHGHLNDNDVASLYNSDKVKALVSLTRGEGFGLPILEAAASGLPVIATNWSAYLDFMNLGRFISIDYDLVPIHQSRQDNNIFMPGSMWANFKEDDFREKILKFYKKSSMPRTWAKELKKDIREGYSFDAIASQYSKKFEKILGLA